jgi:hypothetical protein
MGLIVDMMHKGGPFMWLLLLLLLAAPIPLVVGAVLLAIRRWAPSVLFWMVPMGLVLFGAVGRIQGQIMASEAVAYASPETKSTMLHAGLAVASYTEFSGWGLAAVTLSLSALLVALGLLIGAGAGARWRAASAVLGFLAALAAAPLVVVVGMVMPRFSGAAGPELLVLPLLFVLGALAVGIGALRDNADPAHAARLANGRVQVALLVLGSVVCMVASGSLHGFATLHEAMAHASAESRQTLMVVGIGMMRAWWPPALAGLIFVALAGAITSLGGIKHWFRLRHLISGAVLGLGLLVTLAAPLYANVQAWQVSQGTCERHLGLQVDQVADLPRAVLPGSEQVEHQPLDGFVRSVAWQGSAWRPGSTHEGLEGSWSLPQHPDDADRLLVVAPGSLPASSIVATVWNEGAAGPASASLLVAVDHGRDLVTLRSPWLVSAGAGLLRLDVIPPEAWPEGGDVGGFDSLERALADAYLDGDALGWRSVVFVEGSAEGLAVHDYTQAQPASTPLEAALRGSAEVLEGDVASYVIVPGAGWTLQDLVSHCLAISEAAPAANDDDWYDPPARCGVTAALPAGFEAERAAHQQPRPGLGGLGSAGLTGATAGGDMLILGSLDKGSIQAVIQRHLNQIRYCYQRELTKDPDLAGRVVIKFVVARDGTVSSATVKSSTMGNNLVETCIAGRFMRFVFPEPAGGGIVIVSYPFLFSPAP